MRTSSFVILFVIGAGASCHASILMDADNSPLLRSWIAEEVARLSQLVVDDGLLLSDSGVPNQLMQGEILAGCIAIPYENFRSGFLSDGLVPDQAQNIAF